MINISPPFLNFDQPTVLHYTEEITIISDVNFKCPCMCAKNCATTFLWKIYLIDDYTGDNIKEINVLTNEMSAFPNISLPNGTLAYGLYKFILTVNLIVVESTSSFVTTSFTYIRIIPTGFYLSGFKNLNLTTNKLNVGFLESISFIPVFFSYDKDGLSDPNSLTYKFYCVLIDKGQVRDDFDQSLYLIQPDVPLTAEQFNSQNTCFKKTGLFIIYDLLSLIRLNISFKIGLYYFDISGKSLSFANGLQNYYEGKDYQFLIKTYVPLSKLNVNIIYTASIVLPTGLIPILTTQ